MTRKKAIEKLKEANKEDTESAHVIADNILCLLLIKLGYKDVVMEYEKLDKWYA